MRNLVSVILPVYNGERFLLQTLHSIFQQDHSDLELIAIDDGSQDGSWKILQSVNDSRIRLIRHPRNQGIPRTRNDGMRMARGEFVAFCDQDDLLLRHSLSARVRFLQSHPEARSVFGRLGYLRGELGSFTRVPLWEVGVYRLYRHFGRIPLELLQRRAVFPGSLTTHLLRRELIRKVGWLNSRWRFVDDWEYAVRIAQIAEPRFLDRLVLWHLLHDTNTAVRWARGKPRLNSTFLKETRLLRQWLRQWSAR